MLSSAIAADPEAPTTRRSAQPQTLAMSGARHRRASDLFALITHADHYLVTDPGMTPLDRLQLMNADQVEGAIERFGAASFGVRPAADVLDDWLIASIADQAQSALLSGSLTFKAPHDDREPCPSATGNQPVDHGAARVVDLCRLAISRIERLGRLRDLAAPPIVQRNETRMLASNLRALIAATAATDMPRIASS